MKILSPLHGERKLGSLRSRNVWPAGRRVPATTSYVRLDELQMKLSMLNFRIPARGADILDES